MAWTERFRRLAFIVIDAAFIFKSPVDLQRTAVILHGASCSGKSTVLRRLKRRYTHCAYLEMDHLQYWRIEANPNILDIALYALTDAGVEADKSAALVQSIEQSHRDPGKNPRHGSMVELLKQCLVHDVVIATCGNLPPPIVDNGFYQLLGQCTNKTILHVLIAPDNEVLAKRARARGKEALIGRLIASNDRWLQNRASYALVLTGSESTARILEAIQTSIIAKRQGH